MKIPEENYQQTIIDLANVYGWTVAHFRTARTINGWVTPVAADGKGFPDMVLVRPPRLIFAEIKSDKGKLSREQQSWLDLLKGCPGVECYMWKPDDYPEVIRTLSQHDVKARQNYLREKFNDDTDRAQG